VDRTLSWLAGADSADAVERALTEVDAAIAMVALGVARSVRLCNLPGAEEAAFFAAARAQDRGVAFRVQRDSPRSITMIVGPRLDSGSRLDHRPLDTGLPDLETPA